MSLLENVFLFLGLWVVTMLILVLVEPPSRTKPTPRFRYNSPIKRL